MPTGFWVWLSPVATEHRGGHNGNWHTEPHTNTTRMTDDTISNKKAQHTLTVWENSRLADANARIRGIWWSGGRGMVGCDEQLIHLVWVRVCMCVCVRVWVVCDGATRLLCMWPATLVWEWYSPSRTVRRLVTIVNAALFAAAAMPNRICLQHRVYILFLNMPNILQ